MMKRNLLSRVLSCIPQKIAWVGLFSVMMLTAFTALSQNYPAGFSQVQIANGISNPTALEFAPDGRIFVSEQGGKLHVIKNGVKLATPAIQLSVASTSERGLLGIAFDPGFATNNFIYLYYTVPTGTIHNRISRFVINGDVINPASETPILDLEPLGAGNHNGGAIHFGPDNKLYVATGENAVSSNSQNLDNHLGKILRINTDGSAPADNPFYSTTASAARKRIWAYGLRNPYTFTFQPGTGRLFVNDVGQNTWEEINDATTGGLNFGWPTAEGNSTNPAFTNPVFVYPHGSGDGSGCAIVGGAFYNPTTVVYPSQYVNKYFYMELCNSWINYITITSPITRSPFATNLGSNILSLTLGPDGYFYFLNRGSSSLIKINYTNTQAPVITSQPSNVTVSQGQTATFSVTATGTAPLSYQWRKDGINIAGATSATLAIANAQPSDQGQYSVVVSNSAGSVISNNAALIVNAPNNIPVATITAPANNTIYRGGDVINFSGTGTDAEDSILPASAFTWLLDFHHNTHVHNSPPIAQGVTSGSFTIPNTGETATDVFYRLILVVKDSQGATDTSYVDLLPKLANITINTQPAGLQITIDGQPKTAPYTTASVVGVIRTIGVVSPQTVSGVTYEFDSWQHGGSATQSIATPEADATYTAIYKVSNLRTPENPANTVNGLDYKYYHGSWSVLPDFNTLTPVKAGTVTSFSLTPRTRSDQFGFSFTGFVNVPSDGNYTFYTSSDDGSRLYIGNTLVVDNNGLHSSQERSGQIGLKAGKHAIRVVYFEQGGSEVLTVSYAGPGIAKQVIPAAALFRVAPVACSATGTILREYWANVSGTAVSAIPVNTAPTSTSQLTLFEGPVNTADNYGSRIRGYLCPPVTGSYTFWIASDDNSELWLSTNEDPLNKVKIASVTGWTNSREWTKFTSQRSGTIMLEANKKYYVEALQKEGGGGDNLAVGWQLPNGTLERPIPGSRLSPVILTGTAALYTEDISDNGNDAGWSVSKTGEVESAFSLFPNPCKDLLYVNLSAQEGVVYALSLINLLGAEVLQGSVTGASEVIDVSQLPAGIYTVQVRMGDVVFRRRVVIE